MDRTLVISMLAETHRSADDRNAQPALANTKIFEIPTHKLIRRQERP